MAWGAAPTGNALRISGLGAVVVLLLAGCVPPVADEQASCPGDACNLHFIYVANQGSNDVSVFRMTTKPGSLTPTPGLPVEVSGSPFPSCNSPRGVTLNPAGTLAYVPCDVAAAISGYQVDAATGALAAVAGSPFGVSAGYAPFTIAIERTGQFLYTANEANSGANNVSGFLINAATGALTPLGGSPYSDASANGSQGIVTEPTGQYVYTANKFLGPPSVYCIVPGTGDLNICAGSAAGGTAPNSLTVDVKGQFAYVVNGTSGDVTGYSISPLTGALSPVPSSPFAAGSTLWGVTIDPQVRFLYTGNSGSNDVSGFSIDAAGTLTPVPGSPYAVGVSPVGVGVDSSGQYLYVANQVDNNMSMFSINQSDGSLTSLGAPMATGTGPFWLTVR